MRREGEKTASLWEIAQSDAVKSAWEEYIEEERLVSKTVLLARLKLKVLYSHGRVG